MHNSETVSITLKLDASRQAHTRAHTHRETLSVIGVSSLQSETRATEAERTVSKLQKEVDRLEGKCLTVTILELVPSSSRRSLDTAVVWCLTIKAGLLYFT